MKTRDSIDTRIRDIQAQLATIGPLRLGSLSLQQRRKGPDTPRYYQLSFTHHGRGHTEYIRDEDVEQVRAQVENYRRLRDLVQEWIDLSQERCQLDKHRSPAT